ncbi:MAG: phosphoglycerate kinase [Planctomycetota bacterium]|jgi:phosphoglycerate kinase
MLTNLDVPGLDSLDLDGKRVLMRVDFNVPLDTSRPDEVRISDDTRIRAALPTIAAIFRAGGRPVLMSHLGRPKGQVVEGLRLNPIALRLAELSGHQVIKLDAVVGPEVEASVAAAPADTIVLLENVRFEAGETKGDPELARAMARLGDCFVGDAFGAAHRDHASVCGPARILPAAAGLLLKRELKAFERVLKDPARPLVAILGGAKVSDKLPVIESLLERCQFLLIGGGMAYTFLKARGESVGTSLVQDDQLEAVRANMARAEASGCQILLPTDHIVAASFAKDAEPQVVSEIPEGSMGLDIGPKTIAAYVQAIGVAGTVLWNGPMGVFEWEAFRNGTESVGRAVADCAGYTVVGGGDSVAAIELFGLGDSIDHVSTGGGASLELLEGKDLPGVAVLRG